MTGSPRDRFITVYGRMPVLEALEDTAIEVDKVLVAQESRGENLAAVLRAAKRRGVPVRRVSAQRVKLLAGNGRHDQGVVADVLAPRMSDLESFCVRAQGRRRLNVLVLDGLTNPSNVGMILRSATAAGMDAVVVPKAGTADLGPLVIKASAGVAFRAPIVRCDTAARALRELARAGVVPVGLAGDADEQLFAARLPAKAAYVLGNETSGVSPATREAVERWVRIPLANGVESLNVASAAVVIAYEVARRSGW